MEATSVHCLEPDLELVRGVPNDPYFQLPSDSGFQEFWLEKAGGFRPGWREISIFIMMPRRLDLTFCGVWNCIIVGAVLWMDFVVLLDTFSLRVHQSCLPCFSNN